MHAAAGALVQQQQQHQKTKDAKQPVVQSRGGSLGLMVLAWQALSNLVPASTSIF